MIQSVMEVEKDYSVKKDSLDRLKLSVFNFVLSLSHLPKMSEDQLKLLVSQLSSCLADDSLPELRLCVGSLLLKLSRQPELHLSSGELNIWTSALERHPKATKFFADAFSSLLTSLSSFNEEFESVFDISKCEKLEPPCSQLILTAWKCFSELSQDNEEVASYISAVMCELLLCQKGELKTFAGTLLKAAPNSLSSRPALNNFLKSWTKMKRQADVSTLGLGPTSAILYSCCFPNDLDWSALKTKWEDVIVAKVNRLDIIEVALYQCITCLAVSATRKSDELNILGLLRTVVIGETEESGYPLRVKLLQDSRTLEWFDLMNTHDSFVKEFNLLVQDSLKLIRDHQMDQIYQRKLNDSIAAFIQAEGSLEEIDEEKLLLSLSELKINEIEPQILSLVHRLKSAPSDECMQYLNVFLQLASRLRLEGVIQRISWSVFTQVLQLFVSLGAIPALKKGIYNVASVCPEFLDATEDFTAVLTACLKSKSDYTTFCLFLVNSSNHLCDAFGQWCLGHKKRFKDINWRLQIIPAYISNPSADGKVLDMIHRYISPLLKQLLTSHTEYSKVAEFTKLPEFLGALIPKCWTAEECRDLATGLLSETKKSFSCVQFVEAGRHGAHYDLHLQLCLHATVRQLKSENPDTTEVEQLVREFDWLSKQAQGDLPTLAKTIVEDAIWSKFLKYTLRIGLRALSVEESTLPTLALQIMTNIWRLLLAGQTDEVKAAALKVF